jgi:CheY-like chemotaxis protein
MANILIVDDDAAFRESLAETVRDLGFEPRLLPAGRLWGFSYLKTSTEFCSI